ncbi:stomatin family protein [Natronomonas pharaonis DSM 2160]|uniref:Stomatin family protein n=1 Tax=Natronomonas pharaonis (strain ATCC 35678 / DSM 2160 / CIP 103997 / JCM 8858 / NBRC 14720 / NCIMB 2260 / Gabara) TaxID=348780 RepID=A0A1U7EWC7_NATPD|nr:prohibitin family protein [Natronomonas pharaonis]CAI49388.1 stomatin family protein [Natronomonas pharaonis DSM 2160]
MADDILQEQFGPRLQAAAVAGIVLLLVVGIAFLFSVATVDEGDRGVKKVQGSVTGDVLEPGWHFPLVPFYHSVEYIEIRPQTYTMSGDVFEGDVAEEDAVDFRSADQQRVGADITVRYRVNEDGADEFHREWNTIDQYEQRLLRPETVDTVAREASALNATEANSDEGRELLGDIIADELRSQSPRYVDIESVQVRDIHFDPEFEQALEQVEIAQQEADAERTRAQGDADAERIRAEGEADALREVQEALTEENLALEQIRAYDEGTVYVTDGGTPVILDPEEGSLDDEGVTADD